MSVAPATAPAPAPAPARRAFWLAALRLSLLFAVVFYGVDAITVARSTRWRLDMAWEQSIPYWPAAYLVYYSVVGMPFLVRFTVGEARRVALWERRMALAIAVAALVYLVVPGQLGYAPAAAGAWQPLADLTGALAGRHNLLPSLHVALTWVTVASVWPHTGALARRAMLAWALALMASTLLTHQHHMLDLIAGAVLGALLSARASDNGRQPQP